jgi:hypothetical protein
MMEELLAVAAMVGLSLLIVYKSDQQSIIILKGKLFRADRDQDIAAKVYRKHTRVLSVMLFSFGFSILSVAVILLANKNSLFPLPAAIGLVFLVCGIWGRISSFRAADRELDQVENADLSESAR